MARYRKKPVVVDAFRFHAGMEPQDFPAWAGCIAQGRIQGGDACQIATLEGVMLANDGDWIIKGVKGELYPCKPDVFEQTYEPVEEEAEDA